MKHVIEIRSLVNTLRKIFVKDYRFFKKRIPEKNYYSQNASEILGQ